MSWHLKAVFLERLVYVLIHKTNKISFQFFLRKPKKQSIVVLKQPVVTCFYCMKKGHSVRFCKIRKFSVPRGYMKWIPKECEVPNEKKKSIGSTFVKGPNLVAWTHTCAGNLNKCEGLSHLIKSFGEKDQHWSWINVLYISKTLNCQNEVSWSQSTWPIERTTQRIRHSLSMFLISVFKFFYMFE